MSINIESGEYINCMPREADEKPGIQMEAEACGTISVLVLPCGTGVMKVVRTLLP